MKRKQGENSENSKVVSFKKIRIEENSKKSESGIGSSQHEIDSIKSEAFSLKFTSSQNPISEKNATNENHNNESVTRNVISPTSLSPLNSSCQSPFEENSYQDLRNSEEKESNDSLDNYSENIKTDIWIKLNSVEENLNKTIKSIKTFIYSFRIKFFNLNFNFLTMQRFQSVYTKFNESS